MSLSNLRRAGARRIFLRLFLQNVYAFEEHLPVLWGFLVGLYITIHPPLFFIIIIIQSHTFAAENCAIGNIVN